MSRYFSLGLLLLYFLVPASIWAAPPTGAVKFTILQPSNSIVGTPVTVTVQAQKTDSATDTAYQNDVTLVTSGSATGGGLVDVVDGVGTREINDAIAEMVTLSLSDTESTGLDVSSTREVTFAPLGGGAVWNQVKFWFRDDDGEETTASGFGAENVGHNTNIINVVPGTNFRLRFTIKLNDADGSIAPQLEFKEGTDCTTGNWSTITSSSINFNLRLSDNFIDGASTTQQLVGDPNFTAGRILESTNPAQTLALLQNQSTEYEWSLKVSPDTPFATTYSFRITDSGTVLNTYDQCPSLTIQAPPPRGGGGGFCFNCYETPAIATLPTPTGEVLGVAAFRFTRTLQMGVAGDDVSELQRRLTEEGVYTGPITGYFGPLTFEAVKRYQGKYGIETVGVVGPITRVKLSPEAQAQIASLQAQMVQIQNQFVQLLQQLSQALQSQLQQLQSPSQ